MKKFLLLCLSAGLLACAASFTANATEPEQNESESTVISSETEYRCTVTVYARSNGQTWLYESATVSGQVKGSGGFTKDVKTDSKGRATLVWYSSDELKVIWVKGTGLFDTSVKFEGSYRDGGSYTFYIDA